MEVAIDPATYTMATDWDKAGPFFDNDPVTSEGATHTHAWAANRGAYVYEFDWPAAVPRRAEVSARLSSEHPWYSSPANHFSDVSLLVNERRHPSRRVIPDNGSGRVYRWEIDGRDLRQGRNELRFAISRYAPYRNGLCIYYEAVVDGEDDHPIRVRALD
jgi:hypothetical protein